MKKSASGLGGSFLRIWLSQAVDEFGTAFGGVVIGALAILLLHAGPFQVGLILTLTYTTQPIVGAFAGNIVSRFPVRRVIQVCFFVRAASMATVPVTALFHLLTMWQLFAVVIIEAACAAIFAVAYETGLPRVVPRADLDKANSRLAASSAVSSIGGPSAGGLVAQIVGPAVALWGNTVAFVIAGFSIIGMSRAADGETANSEDPGEPVKQREGWTVIRDHRMLRRVVTTRMISNFAAGIVEANILVFLFGSGQSLQVVGIILALGAAGALVGVVLATRGSRSISVTTRMIVLPALMGFGLMLLPASLTTPIAACDQSISRAHAAGSIDYVAAEEQPMAATDPNNPQHLVSNVEQDRWSDGGANAVTTSVSDDGGRSWTLAPKQPAFSTCAGATAGSVGYYDRASDPWLSIGPDGTAYQTALGFDIRSTDGFGGASSVNASTSNDGGRTWNPPVQVDKDPNPLDLIDKDSVTADPLIPGQAYAVWDRLHFDSLRKYVDDPTDLDGPTRFSMTTDGGRTWSPARTIFEPGPRAQTFDNQILVEPTGPHKGRLIVMGLWFTTDPTTHADTAYIADQTSDDHGATWSAMKVAAPFPMAPPEPYQPGVSQSEVLIRSGLGFKGIHADIFPNFAVDPQTGTIYAAWQDLTFSPAVSKIAVASSADGAESWSRPLRVDKAPGTAPTFSPQIRVAPDGTVGVIYYDLRNATTVSPGLTDLWLERCKSAVTDCTTGSDAWTETRMTGTGSFDITQSIVVYNQYYLGDYEALTTSGNAFVAVFIASAPLATNGATDEFTTRVAPLP